MALASSQKEQLTTDYGPRTLSSAHIDFLDKQNYPGRNRAARNRRRLKSPIAQRPPQLLDQVWVLGCIKNIYQPSASLRIDLDQRGHALIARLLVSDVAE